MVIKPRGENVELKLLRLLRVRKRLEEKDENNYIYLEKGKFSEKLFDQYLLGLTNEFLILNNLLLEVNNTLFQIDSLLITQKKIFIFEVKKHEVDFYIVKDRWYMLSGKEIKNPLIQVIRSESLFRQLLQELRFSVMLDLKLFLSTQNFFSMRLRLKVHLYFIRQLGRLLKNLDSYDAPRVSGGHMRLADKLVSLHITDNPYSRLPVYTYEELEKGIICQRGCFHLEDTNRHTLVCNKCGFIEDKEAAILRSIEEFRFLFPEKRITVDVIYNWCQVIRSKRLIREISSKNFELVLFGRGSYYVDKKR
ncbi:nuclease-related domain-containing protein [Bacillus timonensis]|uniref:nuclease-related domain-containing protein n=1 Tax=Bacillus timonensis TaxID=1033734 RepID=UPI000289CFE1|nr:nuclease-related domain-containing protein [Bacillus timonensis]